MRIDDDLMDCDDDLMVSDDDLMDSNDDLMGSMMICWVLIWIFTMSFNDLSDDLTMRQLMEDYCKGWTSLSTNRSL